MGGSIPETALLQAMLARRSVRRYSREPLDDATLVKVREIAASPKPLIPDNRLEVGMRDDVVRRDLVVLLGAYGRLITPPHALVPHICGASHPLVDLGYRVEQMVVRMTALGVGTCYVGTLPREEQARTTLGIPADARIGALLVFGRASQTAGGRAINSLVRSAAGGGREPDLARWFFRKSFDNPSPPPDSLRPFILAAACAPSACNAQPWRFLWQGDRLWLFVTRNNPKYRGAHSEQYCLYDGGIAMANVSLAMEALGITGAWQLVEANDAAVPAHPANLHPVARLSIAGH